MSSKPNNFAGNPNNQYNVETIWKESSDFYGQNIRTVDTRSVADKYYTHFRASYNGTGKPTEVTYYRGTTQHTTEVGCIADLGGSLAGKYFFIYSAPDQKQYYVWYKVSGVGTDPAIFGAIGIEVDIQTNDSAQVIALATALTINASVPDKFIANRVQAVVEIKAFSSGETTNSTPEATGFTITNQSGTQDITSHIVIEYDGVDPIYQGQVLKDYHFDIYSGKFEKNVDLSVSDGVTVNQGTNPWITSTTNGALETTQLANNAELQAINTELNTQTTELIAANSSLNAIETAVQSIDTDFDVPLSTRASEATLSSLNTKVANNYGVSTGAVRTASQVGNATGAADFGLGATGDQTLRTTANIAGTDPNGVATSFQSSGVDNGNSTTALLGSGATFTGAWRDLSQFVNITLMIKADVISAVGGLKIQYSTDGVTVTRELSGTYIPDSKGLYLTLPSESRYFRIIYTNGAVAQTSFVIQTIIDVTSVGITTIPVNFPIEDTNSVTINRSIITGKSTDGQYLNQRADGVSMGNSTNATLLAGATFTGPWEDVLGYANITITCIADVASATDGLKLEYSTDGVNVDSSDLFTTSAGNGNQYSCGATARYFRVRYVNGGTNQSSFRLQTIYHITAPKPSTHRIDDSISGQNDAELTKAVITGKNPDGTFVNEGVSGVVSTNSTTTPLGIGGVFQGPYFDTSEFAAVSFAALADQAGTILIETSDDGTTVIRTTTASVAANSPFYISQTSTARFIRIRFTNGGIAQTSFHLQTMMKTTTISPTAVTISTPLTTNSVALNTRSVLSGQQENGTFNNVGLSNTASIKVAVTDRPSEVRSRVKVQARIFNTSLAADPTVLHTVTAGKTFYLESMVISALNNTNAIGEWRIADGGVDTIGYLVGEKTAGAAATSSSSSPALPEPIPFTTNFGVREITGDIILSIYIIGYEEAN